MFLRHSLFQSGGSGEPAEKKANTGAAAPRLTEKGMLSQDVLKVAGLQGDLERFNGLYKVCPGMTNDDAPVWRTITAVADPEAPADPDQFYIYRDADEHWWAMGRENDVESNSGDVTSEETGSVSPAGLTFGGDYGSPTVQVGDK